MINITKLFLTVFVGALILNACETSELRIVIPNCIEGKIKAIKAQDVQNPPTEIWEWTVDGKRYYYITSGCCDQYNYLYDKNCNVVCAPDGGISGTGSGNCPDFIGQIRKTLIWKDERN